MTRDLREDSVVTKAWFGSFVYKASGDHTFF